MTIIGAGGIGKSRLAIQAAAGLHNAYLDGVSLVELAPLEDPGLVTQTVATSLGVGGEGTIPSNTASSTDDATLKKLVQYLKSKEILLILDNCEHLLDACTHLCERLLRTCPELKVLATSRERLGLTAEVLLQAPPMRLLGRGSATSGVWEAVANSDAAQLFIARAVAVQKGFQLDPTNALIVADICQRLDGMPLVIELAAARLRALSLQELADRLGDRFQLLTGGSRAALPRHRTLLATIQWSYDLLTNKEKMLFRRASVFRGGFTLEAVEAICSGNGLSSPELVNLMTGLVDKSLILTRRGTCWTLCFLSISHAALRDFEQATRLGEEALSLFREIDSKRGIAGSAETLGRVLTQKGNYSGAEILFQEGLSLMRELGDISEIASILASYGIMARLKGNLEHAMTCFQDCLKLDLDLGFKRRIADTLVEIALLAQVQQENELATRLSGATQALREVISVPISPFQRTEHDRALAAIQADLGTQDFERFWQAGRDMSVEEAIGLTKQLRLSAH